VHSFPFLLYSNNTSYNDVSKLGTGYLNFVYMTAATFYPLLYNFTKKGVHFDGRTEVEDRDKLRKITGSSIDESRMEIIILSKTLLPEAT